MGSNFANEMADGTLADLGIHVTLRQAIGWHLQGNHFPPVPSSMIDPCIEAIDACNDEDSSRLIALPEGITWRNQESAPAWAIVEGHHLDAWIGYYAYEEEI